jgi:hypothetical protein
MVKVTIDDSVHDARGNERLIDLLNRIGTKLAQVCYHPQLGPIQTCDTCLLETNGQLVRACGTDVSDGMTVSTQSAKTFEAQRQAFDESSAITCFTVRCATTLQGQTVTQWPQETQLDSPMGEPPSHWTRGCASMLGHAGFFTGLPKTALDGMIEVWMKAYGSFEYFRWQGEICDLAHAYRNQFSAHDPA